MEKIKRARIILILMIISSVILATFLQPVILNYIAAYPNSFFTRVVCFIGKIKFGWAMRFDNEEYVRDGAYYTPFFFFLAISCVIYFKFLKRK